MIAQLQAQNAVMPNTRVLHQAWLTGELEVWHSETRTKAKPRIVRLHSNSCTVLKIYLCQLI